MCIMSCRILVLFEFETGLEDGAIPKWPIRTPCVGDERGGPDAD